MGTFTKIDDPDERQHDAALHLGLHCKGKRKSSGIRIQYCLKLCLIPLDIYNGLS